MVPQCITCGITEEQIGFDPFECTACQKTHTQCRWCRENDVFLYTCPALDESRLVPWWENKVAQLPVVNGVSYHLSLRKLQSRLWRCQTISDIIDLAYEFDGYGLYRSIHPWQRREELRGLIETFQEHEPETVVEIGTGKGGTLFVMSRTLKSVERIISVDLPGGQYGGGYTDKQMKFFSAFNDSIDYTFIRSDSHLASTRECVEKNLPNGTTDALYIDADHSYEGVTRDFNLYQDLVAADGVIGVHDIVHRLNDDQDSDYGVDEFWADIQDVYPTEEIISDPKAEAYGNGIVYPVKDSSSGL